MLDSRHNGLRVRVQIQTRRFPSPFEVPHCFRRILNGLQDRRFQPLTHSSVSYCTTAEGLTELASRVRCILVPHSVRAGLNRGLQPLHCRDGVAVEALDVNLARRLDAAVPENGLNRLVIYAESVEVGR
jgi:hypothetical protein